MFTYDQNHSGLRFGVTFEDTTAVLTLCGELDVASVDFLESVLVSVRDAGVEQVRIDASGVTFADCSTLSVLHRQRDHYAQCGCRLVVAVPGDALTRLVELAGDRGILGDRCAADAVAVHARRSVIGSWSGHISRMATKRQTVEPHAGDKRYVRRDDKGRIAESDDTSRSLSQDVRRPATTTTKPGQGDKGDRPKK